MERRIRGGGDVVPNAKLSAWLFLHDQSFFVLRIFKSCSNASGANPPPGQKVNFCVTRLIPTVGERDQLYDPIARIG